MNILLNGKVVEELCTIVHKSKASQIGKKLCVKLLDTIPRQLFEITIQAAIGSKVIARETLKPYKKDVTAKLVSKFTITYLTTMINFSFNVRFTNFASFFLSTAVMLLEGKNCWHNKRKGKRR